MSLLLTTALLASLLVLIALGMTLLQRRFAQQSDPLIEAVDALLPQTQCAQCGYPGCRPYAEAVVDGAAINLCPPGGLEVHLALADLLQNSEPGEPPAAIAPMLAVIDESQCIGCALCLPACPVDAIAGAQTMMHTIISQDCTGCELCVEPCPVDCITMQVLPVPAPDLHRRHTRAANHAIETSRGCISCQQCDPVCPENLPVMQLHQAAARDQLTVVEQLGVERCIDCSLCDNACPSDIPLARNFVLLQHELEVQAQQTATQNHYKARFSAHQVRHQQAEQATKDRREQRLGRKRSWT